MAKNFKPTGKKRFFKKRFGNKRVLASTKNTSTYVPRTLYPALPTQMRLSFRFVGQENYNVNATAMTLQSISSVSPVQINGAFPAGFPAMMLLYSRACVDRVTTKISFIPFLVDPQQIHQSSPYYICSGVLPSLDLQGIQLNAGGYQRLASVPHSKNTMIGNVAGQNTQCFYHSVDVRKALADGHENVFNIESTPAGQMNMPGPARAPAIYLAVYNPTAVAHGYLVQRDTTYHMTFTMPHMQTTEQYNVQ